MAGGNTMHVERWICLLIFSLLPAGLRAVQIKNLTGPTWIENGTIEHVILDCDFDHNPDEKGIVVKWFLNEDPQPIYQWIPEYNSRTTSPKFQTKLDLEFKVNNKPTMHRALKILKPTTDLSGKYRCDVLSLESQDSAEKIIVIYAPPKNLIFYAMETPNRELNLTCEAENVFPQPQLHIYRLKHGSVNKDRLPTRKSLHETEFGTFNIEVSTQVNFSPKPEEGPAFFECEIIIGTQYNSRKKIQYISGLAVSADPTNGMTVLTSSTLILPTTLILAAMARIVS